MVSSTFSCGRKSCLSDSQPVRLLCPRGKACQCRSTCTMNHYESLWITMNHYESLWITMNHYESLWITMNIGQAWPGMARPWPGFMHPTPAEPQIEQATRLYETLRDYSNLPIVSYSTIFLAANLSSKCSSLAHLARNHLFFLLFHPDQMTLKPGKEQTSPADLSFKWGNAGNVAGVTIHMHCSLLRPWWSNGPATCRITCLSFWNIMGHVSRTFDIWYWTKYTASAREAHPSHRPCRSWNPCLCAKVILKYPI